MEQEVFGNVTTRKGEALKQIGLGNSKEKEMALSVDGLEARRVAMDVFSR